MSSAQGNYDADVLVVSVVRGPRLAVRVRQSPLPLTASTIHTSADEALGEIREWLVERLGRRVGE
jgi:hypothetical protein